jgi:hypothetical protein
VLFRVLLPDSVQAQLAHAHAAVPAAAPVPAATDTLEDTRGD